jgi:hypothetical protein
LLKHFNKRVWVFFFWQIKGVWVMPLKNWKTFINEVAYILNILPLRWTWLRNWSVMGSGGDNDKWSIIIKKKKEMVTCWTG